MAMFGCPPWIIAMVQQFHDKTQARFQNDGEYSKPFPVTDRVEQGSQITFRTMRLVFALVARYLTQGGRNPNLR